MDPPKKRDRVAKACVFCRKKKIKCDGMTPCSNCKTNECVYASQERKPRVRKTKMNKAQSILTLNDRLHKLETLLTSLTSHLGDSLVAANSQDLGKLHDVLKVENSDSFGSNVSLSKQTDISETYDSDVDDSYDNESRASKSQSLTSLTKNDGGQNDSIQKTFYLSDQYFGSHSSFHIFSEKSLSWIYSKLPATHATLLVPLQNLPMIFALCMKSFNHIWFSPRPTDLQLKILSIKGWFPEDHKLIFDLIDCFDDVFLASSICSSSAIRQLFEKYYDNQLRLNESEAVSFKRSELLIMNISLSLCISSVIDKRMTSNNGSNNSGKPPKLFSYTTNELIQLQTRFFASAIYYYDMVSVMSEGLKTIQAILLLIIFLETSWIKSHVNYILASIAVRYAQEIGLHRLESFQRLSEEEADLRRRIWWFCEYIDMEICYRNGKPPLINQADVSTCSGKDLFYSMKKFNHNNKFDVLDPSLLQYILQTKGIEGYIKHFINLLTKLRAESYHCLFSASSCNYSFDDLIKTLEDLNGKMFEMSDAITPSLKPRFYNDPEFEDSLIFSNSFNDDNASMEYALTYHLSFFTHFMTINRLISQIDNVYINHDNSIVLNFRTLALNSSRTILHIVRRLGRKDIPFSCINWLIYYPVGAFLILISSCLNRCSSVETLNDVNLLIDVTLNFFAFNQNVLNATNGPRYSKLYNQRESTTSLMCGLMLNIGLRIIESKSPYKFIENNNKLQQYFKDCQSVFPEVYKRRNMPPGRKINGHTLPNFQMESAEVDSVEVSPDSIFSLPSGMLPGKTGYFAVPFEASETSNDHKKGSDLSTIPTSYAEDSPFSFAKIGFENEAEFNENLDQFFGGIATPNFFFDNNIGL